MLALVCVCSCFWATLRHTQTTITMRARINLQAGAVPDLSRLHLTESLVQQRVWQAGFRHSVTGCWRVSGKAGMRSLSADCLPALALCMYVRPDLICLCALNAQGCVCSCKCQGWSWPSKDFAHTASADLRCPAAPILEVLRWQHGTKALSVAQLQCASSPDCWVL